MSRMMSQKLSKFNAVLVITLILFGGTVLNAAENNSTAGEVAASVAGSGAGAAIAKEVCGKLKPTKVRVVCEAVVTTATSEIARTLYDKVKEAVKKEFERDKTAVPITI